MYVLGETPAPAPSFWDKLLNAASNILVMKEQTRQYAAGMPVPVAATAPAAPAAPAPVAPKILPLAIGGAVILGAFLLLRKRGRRR